MLGKYAKWDEKMLNYVEKQTGGYSQDQLAEDEGLRLEKPV